MTGWGVTGGLRPVDLRCEHRRGVPCVDVPAPRLRWTLAGEGRGRAQTAYRVLVSEDPAGPVAGCGTSWDSGRVAAADAVEVPYRGRPLEPGRTYHWAVMIWDEDGRASPWSTPAAWRTGIGWSAEWIGHDGRADPGVVDPAFRYGPTVRRGMPPAPLMRREFDCPDDPVRTAVLYVTARGLAEMRVNGVRVDDAELVPGWTDYTQRQLYHAVDVTGLLRPGRNALGATLADGWYSGFVGSDPRRPGNLYGRRPELLCELHVTAVSGQRTVVGTDGAWRSALGPVRAADLLRGEAYDARFEQPGWACPGFDDSTWVPVVRHERDDIPLVPDRAEPVRVVEDIAPVRITRTGPATHVVDLGQNIVGRVRLRLRAPRGTRVRLRHAEALDGDGSLHRENLRTATAEDVYVAAGGPAEYEPACTLHGFRYVEVDGLPGLAAEDVTGRVMHTDMPVTGSFSCSDPLVEQLWRNVVWGLRGNVVSVPTDCPQRDERMGWLADAQVFAPTAALVMDVSAFLTRWLDDVAGAQNEEGVYPDVAPRVPTTRDGAPAWADAGVILPLLLHRTYGDTEILRRHWSAMDRYLAHLQRTNPDLRWRHRRHNDYGDWLAAGEDTSRELVAAAYWAHDAALMAEAARALADEEAAGRYRRLRAELVAAFRADHVDADGRVTGDTQTGYALALGFDLLPTDLREPAAAHLVANIERHGGHLATGFLGVGMLCPVLAATGHADVAHRLLTNRTFPSWGYTIDRGATTIWERWDGWTDEHGFASPAMNSFNHYALGSVGAWLVEGVAGIRAGAPGYRHVLVEPVPGPMTHAAAEYAAVRGTIRSSWRRDGHRFRLEVTIPPGCTASVLVPGTEITEGAVAARDAPGVVEVRAEGAATRVEVTSGSYRFTART